MSSLVRYLFHYSPRWLTFTALLSLTTGILNLILIDRLNSALVQESGFEALLVFWVLCLLLPLCRYSGQHALVWLSNDLILNLRLTLSKQVLGLSLRDHEEKGQAKVFSVLTHDIGAIGAALVELPMLAINSTIVLGAFCYLFWLQWSIGLIMTAVAGMSFLVFNVVQRVAYRHFQIARTQQDTFFALFAAVNDGAKELRLNSRKKFAYIQSLDSAGSLYKDSRIASETRFAFAGSMGQFLLFFVLGSFLFFIPQWSTLEGDSLALVLSGTVLAILYVVGPLESLSHGFPVMQQAAVSFGRVRDLGLNLNSDPSVEPLIQPPRSIEKIALVGATHQYYREDQDAFFSMGPIDLTFKQGDLVFLVGGNGCGKTTLAKLLVGLYTPFTGQVVWDGSLVTSENLESYRQLFSVVFSDIFLMQDLNWLDREDIEEAGRDYLKTLQLSKKVGFQDQSLTTLELSQGQRKRLALLIAYLEDRPFYVFDEWAADQDPTFKDFFYRTLLQDLKARGKTVLVITHDDHYFHLADRLIKMDNGQIEFQTDRLDAYSKLGTVIDQQGAKK